MGADLLPRNILQQYDLRKDVWALLPPMPTPRYDANTHLLTNKLYVAGTNRPTYYEHLYDKQRATLHNFNLSIPPHQMFQAAVSVNVQWRPLRCTMQRHVLGPRFPWCLANAHTGVWYGTRLGGCVYLEDCAREEDTRAPSSRRMSISLTQTKVLKRIFFCQLQFVANFTHLVTNFRGFSSLGLINQKSHTNQTCY